MRMNKNKFCTSVGHNSARDLEQYLEIERRLDAAKELAKKKGKDKQKK